MASQHSNTQFTPFPRLPTELQLEIWRLAFLLGSYTEHGNIAIIDAWSYLGGKGLRPGYGIRSTHCFLGWHGNIRCNTTLAKLWAPILPEGSIYLRTHKMAPEGIIIRRDLGMRGLLQACYRSRCVVLKIWKRLLKDALMDLENNWQERARTAWRVDPRAGNDDECWEVMEKTEKLLGIVNRLEKGLKRKHVPAVRTLPEDVPLPCSNLATSGEGSDDGFETCYSDGESIYSACTGIRSRRGGTWEGTYTLNYSTGFAGGAPFSANYKGVREGREDEMGVYGVGRTGKRPAKVPEAMVKAAIESYLDDTQKAMLDNYLEGAPSFTLTAERLRTQQRRHAKFRKTRFPPTIDESEVPTSIGNEAARPPNDNEPLTFTIKGNAKLIIDGHEIHTREIDGPIHFTFKRNDESAKTTFDSSEAYEGDDEL